MSTGSVEVVYRGIFQKTLAKNICRGVVLAARKEGKIGIAFGRYSDSPERNGIPAKQFAVVSDTEEELEDYLSRYEPDNNDVTIAADDTLCKGVESWAWYGLQPINKLLGDGGTLLVTSTQSANKLIKTIHRKGAPYNLATVKAAASFSGLWVYKDDHTDVRLLGALAKVAPHIVGLDAVTKAIGEQWKDESKVASAMRAYDMIESVPVGADQGSDAEPFSFSMPGWTRRLRSLAQSHLQEVLDAHHAAGDQLRHLHQVHALLAELSGHLLRHHARRLLRRQYGGLLWLWRLRGRLSGGRVRHHGQRGGLRGQR
jgi:pyruvate ferredoxin oxidoreductase delta subunit